MHWVRTRRTVVFHSLIFMLACYLTALLVLELGLYLLAGVWLSSNLGVSTAECVLVALLMAIGLRLLMVGATFTLAHRHRARLPADVQLTAAGAMKLFLGEFLAFTALFTVLQPLTRWFGRRSAPLVADARLPVILIPGIYCNGAVWWWLVRQLRARGLHNLVPVTLEPPLASIDGLARQLADEIERVCRQTQARQLVLVGHSMGGLIARAYLRDFGAARVARVITLASPHHGSELARHAIGASGRQLRPGNPWLEALNATEHATPPVPIVSLFSWHDNYVAPQDSAIVAHATNMTFVGIGHLALLFSQPVAQRLYAELAAAYQK